MGIERMCLLALASAMSLLLLPATAAADARNDTRVALAGAHPASCADFASAVRECAESPVYHQHGLQHAPALVIR
ncbi:MAG: hypothetical protein ACTHK2_09220 [Dokdonella sp.]|uniref:hypothetical protein n=1 Tax=Dokdonella sp. TaxID=2291710 RepID=UPI003F7DCCED